MCSVSFSFSLIHSSSNRLVEFFSLWQAHPSNPVISPYLMMTNYEFEMIHDCVLLCAWGMQHTFLFNIHVLSTLASLQWITLVLIKFDIQKMIVIPSDSRLALCASPQEQIIILYVSTLGWNRRCMELSWYNCIIYARLHPKTVKHQGIMVYNSVHMQTTLIQNGH